MNRLSLRLRLVAFVGLLVAGTIALFAFTFYVVLERTLISVTDQQLRERARFVNTEVHASISSISGDGVITLSPLVEFDAPGIYVEVLTSDGTVLATSPNLGTAHLPTDQTLLASAQAGKSTSATLTVGEDEQLRMLVQPLEGGTTNLLLLVAESLEPMQRTLAQARALLLSLGSLALLFAVTGGAVFTGRTLTPIHRLTRTAARVAETGQYHERVPPSPRHDEIGELTNTINELIATVEQTLRQQRQFLADTSHELRSPLTVVLANLDLLRRNLDPHERELSVIEATAEAQRMRRLVNDLLMLAQSDTAQVIAATPMRLDRLVDTVVTTVARQAPDHLISATIDESVRVNGDEERLTQMLRNLLENAVHHTPPGTQIVVSLYQSDGLVHIAVADDGPGMSAEHLPHIWQRFYRLDKARRREHGGAGLGLAIVKYIAEAHGGSVAVASTVGKGSTFTVTLPLPAQEIEHHTSAITGVYSGERDD